MSSITFMVNVPPEPPEAHLRMRITRAIVSALTGLDPVRQECTVVASDPPVYRITLYEARLPPYWLEDGTALIRQGLLSALTWEGEIAQPFEPPVYDNDWHVIPTETSPSSVTFTADTSMGPMKATTKWDGCTHLWIDDEYTHICDLDQYIAYLQAVRAKARAYFDGEFEVAPLSKAQYVQKIATFQESKETPI